MKSPNITKMGINISHKPRWNKRGESRNDATLQMEKRRLNKRRRQACRSALRRGEEEMPVLTSTKAGCPWR